MGRHSKTEHMNVDPCSNDGNEVETVIPNSKSGFVTDSNCETNVNSEVMDESTDLSDLEVVYKTDDSVESDEGKSKVNIGENLGN